MTTLVRQIEDSDMVELSSWFSRRKWPIPPGEGTLPESGYVAVKDGVPMAAAWVYLTNSKIAFIEWSATNPDVGIAGLKALKLVVEYIKKITEGHVNCFMQFVPNEKLAKFMEKSMGFKNSERASLMVLTRRG